MSTVIVTLPVRFRASIVLIVNQSSDNEIFGQLEFWIFGFSIHDAIFLRPTYHDMICQYIQYLRSGKSFLFFRSIYKGWLFIIDQSHFCLYSAMN